jgi:molecular chaperone GrpE
MPSSHEIDAEEQHTTEDAALSEPGEPEPAARQAAAEAGQDELSSELALAEDRYKRALAGLENYRKRSAREVEQRMAGAKESMLIDWLQVLDSLERAMQMQPNGPCHEGLQAVMGQMDAVLERQGVQRVGTPGEAFDPERHEAIAVRACEEAPDHTIVEVLRSGFALGGRVIRPAQVVVARASERAR